MAFCCLYSSRSNTACALRTLTQHLCDRSVEAKEYDEARSIWQGRVNHGWRFYFLAEGDSCGLLDIMAHPEERVLRATPLPALGASQFCDIPQTDFTAVSQRSLAHSSAAETPDVNESVRCATRARVRSVVRHRAPSIEVLS